MVRWEDFKADTIEVLSEFKKHKIGLIGVGLITFMILMGLLAPYIAPGVADEWDRGAYRWRANPSQAAPTFVDWITRDDYARQEHFQDYDHSSSRRYPIEGELELETQIGPFSEIGERNVTVVWEEEDRVLAEEVLEVEEREGVENISVEDFSVEPAEDFTFDFAPVEVVISATIIHEDPDGEARTIELDMPPGEAIRDYETEWTLEPGEQEDIEVRHTFRFDGLYAIYLGEEFEAIEIGIGGDVDIIDFDVTEVDETYEAFAQVANLIDEERTVRMRVDEVIEREDQADEFVTRAHQDWTLEPGEERPLEWAYSFEADGVYQFIVGSQVVEVEVGEDDDDEDTQALTTSSVPGTEEQLQQNDEVTARLDMDTTVSQGEFVTVEIEAENPLEEEQTISLRVDDEEMLRSPIARAGDLYKHSHTFTYDMQYDRFPKEIFFEFEGTSDLYRRRVVTIERPDSDDLEGNAGFRFDGRLELVRERRGDRIGDFHETISTIRRMQVRDDVHSQIQSYLNEEYGHGNFYDPGERNINPVQSAFGKANEDWLGDPEPLKGEYEITIEIDAINLGGEEEGQGELDDANVHIGGAVYGIFGTDRDRRDLFLGWVWGARYGLYAGGIVALTTILFSTTFGMTSAYYGGWVDELMSRIHEIIMGIPTLPILIIILEFYSRSINMFVLVYALLMWRGAARVIRARGLQVAQDTYIEAAESLGSGSARIITKHMIPQILPYAVAQAALLVPIVIMAEAGLHILGLGDPGIVTWGTILNDARAANAVMNYQESWFWILFPGIGMVIIGFGFISTGMALERIINPEMQQR